MMNQNLQQTLFHIEKLKSVVNVGRSSAYHIYTSPGPALGHLGQITEPVNQGPANDSIFKPATISRTLTKSPLAWISKTLSALHPR